MLFRIGPPPWVSFVAAVIFLGFSLLFILGATLGQIGDLSLFGYPVCWVNRNGGPFDELGATPAVAVRDLQQMADWALVHMTRLAAGS